MDRLINWWLEKLDWVLVFVIIMKIYILLKKLLLCKLIDESIIKVIFFEIGRFNNILIICE